MAPVRLGDILRLEGKVESLAPSKTKPQGTVGMKWTMYNQHGQAVYAFTPGLSFRVDRTRKSLQADDLSVLDRTPNRMAGLRQKRPFIN